MHLRLIAVHGPFLLAKVPLIGQKLLGGGKATAYDKAGKIRNILGRQHAYEKAIEEHERGLEWTIGVGSAWDDLPRDVAEAFGFHSAEPEEQVGGKAPAAKDLTA